MAAASLRQCRNKEVRKGITMKKSYKLEELDCANCAAKMEDAVNKIEGVASASISFMQQRMTFEAPDDRFEELLKKAENTMRRIEPDVRVVM